MDAKIYRSKKILPFFLAPAFILMFVYLYYPFVQNILNSFMHIKYIGTSGGEWNQPFFENYVKMFRDPKMGIALKNTLIMIFWTIVGQVGIALVLALLVTNIKKGRGFFRTVFFFPIVISATALVEERPSDFHHDAARGLAVCGLLLRHSPDRSVRHSVRTL